MHVHVKKSLFLSLLKKDGDVIDLPNKYPVNELLAKETDDAQAADESRLALAESIKENMELKKKLESLKTQLEIKDVELAKWKSIAINREHNYC